MRSEEAEGGQGKNIIVASLGDAPYAIWCYSRNFSCSVPFWGGGNEKKNNNSIMKKREILSERRE
jgi:hypothetical protein